LVAALSGRLGAFRWSLWLERACWKVYFSAPEALSVGRWRFGRRCSREPAAIGKAWIIIGSSYFVCDELDDLSVGKCSSPAGKMGCFGFIPVLLQFVKSQDEIPQGGHGKGAVGRSRFAAGEWALEPRLNHKRCNDWMALHPNVHFHFTPSFGQLVKPG